MAKKRKKRRKNRKIRVLERKLGGKVWGFAHIGDNLIEIDSRLKPKMHLRVVVHELAHLAFPTAPEYKILEAEKIIGKTLWEMGYRKINE